MVVFAWVSVLSGAYFYTMKRFGFLRLDKAVEIIGLDIAELGGVSNEVYEKIKLEFGHTLTGFSSPR